MRAPSRIPHFVLTFLRARQIGNLSALLPRVSNHPSNNTREFWHFSVFDFYPTSGTIDLRHGGALTGTMRLLVIKYGETRQRGL